MKISLFRNAIATASGLVVVVCDVLLFLELDRPRPDHAIMLALAAILAAAFIALFVSVYERDHHTEDEGDQR